LGLGLGFILHTNILGLGLGFILHTKQLGFRVSFHSPHKYLGGFQWLVLDTIIWMIWALMNPGPTWSQSNLHNIPWAF
jgi:hypothetical protein